MHVEHTAEDDRLYGRQPLTHYGFRPRLDLIRSSPLLESGVGANLFSNSSSVIDSHLSASIPSGSNSGAKAGLVQYGAALL